MKIKHYFLSILFMLMLCSSSWAGIYQASGYFTGVFNSGSEITLNYDNSPPEEIFVGEFYSFTYRNQGTPFLDTFMVKNNFEFTASASQPDEVVSVYWDFGAAVNFNQFDVKLYNSSDFYSNTFVEVGDFLEDTNTPGAVRFSFDGDLVGGQNYVLVISGETNAAVGMGNIEIIPTPIPSACLLMLSGIFGVFSIRRKIVK